MLRTLHSSVYISSTSAHARIRVIRWFHFQVFSSPPTMSLRRAGAGFHSISVAFSASFEASGECFGLDEQLHVVESSVLQFLHLEQSIKLPREHFESPRAAGRSGVVDASFVAHITVGPVYFQYTSSRPHQSYKVVSLPSIQLTPNKSSPTGGRRCPDLL